MEVRLLSGERKALWQRARDFAAFRSRGVRGWVKHSTGTSKRLLDASQARRLHVGSGAVALEGWLNVDLQKLPEVDLAIDITESFPFKELDYVFAEHFLEHLEVDQGLLFLRRCSEALGNGEGGWIRVSTPNLDWAWQHVYQPIGAGQSAQQRKLSGLRANRSFYGWGHRFLWNRELLAEALECAGFEDLRWCAWGESQQEAFDGLERHEQYEDTAELPHVLVVEAQAGRFDPQRYAEFSAVLEQEFLRYD